MTPTDEIIDVGNIDIMDFSRGVIGLAEVLKAQYKMSEDTVFLCLVALEADDERFGKDYTLRNFISRRNLFDLRDKVQSEFKAQDPKITKRDFEEYFENSNATIKDYLVA